MYTLTTTHIRLEGKPGVVNFVITNRINKSVPKEWLLSTTESVRFQQVFLALGVERPRLLLNIYCSEVQGLLNADPCYSPFRYHFIAASMSPSNNITHIDTIYFMKLLKTRFCQNLVLHQYVSYICIICAPFLNFLVALFSSFYRKSFEVSKFDSTFLFGHSVYDFIYSKVFLFSDTIFFRTPSFCTCICITNWQL